jgi:hypothetical protein
MSAGWLLAQLEWPADFQQTLLIGARLVIALLAGVVGWYASLPLARVLYSAAFHRRIPAYGLLTCRLAATAILGVLAFLFFPIGFGSGWGGLGFGPGGWGEGGGGGGEVSKDTKDSGAAGKDKDTGTAVVKDEPFPIEMVVSDRYQGGGKYYLIHGEKPAWTLTEVEKYLREHKQSFSRLEIIIYANSVSSEHPAVVALKNLAQRLDLGWTIPADYLSKVKE